MDREATVALLREIMSTCTTFWAAKTVSVTKDAESDEWSLSVSWIPDGVDMNCLRKMAAKQQLEILMKDGRLIFRSTKDVNG